MRDTYIDDETFDLASFGKGGKNMRGMRHSIRPRRAVLEQAQKRALDEALEVPASDSPLAAEPTELRWDQIEIEDPGKRRAKSAAMEGRCQFSVRGENEVRSTPGGITSIRDGT